MINITDVLKGKFLEEFSAIPVGGMLIAIALAFALGLFIVYIYRITYAGVSFSKNFAGCMIMITMVTALVILVINSNIVLSLGMVGALSIVRFRTAVKEPADTAFLFWAIATGILCGAGYITISILATVLVGLLVLLIHNFSGKRKTDSFMVVLRYTGGDEPEQALSKLPGYQMKNKTMSADATELVAEVRLSGPDMAQVSALKEMSGVTEVTVMRSITGSVL